MDSDRSLVLPQAFLDRMKDMLQDDYDAFLQAYDQPRTYGLRVNTAKISCEEFEKIVPFEVKKIPWISNGYFYREDVRPSRCPLYQAGLYYLQGNLVNMCWTCVPLPAEKPLLWDLP